MTCLQKLEMRIRAVKKILDQKIKTSDDGGSALARRRANRHMDEIYAIQESLRNGYKRLAFLEVAVGIEVSPKEGGFLRHLQVLVTEAMIKNQRLTLTPHVRAMDLRVGEKMELTLRPTDDPKDDEIVSTDLMEQGKKLRCRGPIRRFYLKAKIQPNTFVLLEEVEPGKWVLLPGSSPQATPDEEW